MAGIRVNIDFLNKTLWATDNNRETTMALTRQIGMMASAWEHRMPELLFTNEENPGEAVSAVKALAVAAKEGQKIYTITSENVNSVLPVLNVRADVKEDIRDAVAVGKVATVSQNQITVGGWTGVGYIISDPETGTGAYMISGGSNGGQFRTLKIASGLLFLFAAISLLGVAAFSLSVLPLFLTTLAVLIIKVSFDEDINFTCANFLIGIGLGTGLYLNGYLAKIAAIILTVLAFMMATGEMDADTCKTI